MTNHEEKLKTEIEELQIRLESLKGRRVYKENFEEEMRDIIDTLHIIVANNPIFLNFKELKLPVRMNPDWFEEEMYEDEYEAFDSLKKMIKENERSCRQLLTVIKTLPKEKKEKKVIKIPKTDPKPINKKPKPKKVEKKPEIALKTTKLKEKKEKDLVETKVRVGTSTFIESTFKMKEKEFIIFIFGLFLGIIIGFILGIVLE